MALSDHLHSRLSKRVDNPLRFCRTLLCSGEINKPLLRRLDALTGLEHDGGGGLEGR